MLLNKYILLYKLKIVIDRIKKFKVLIKSYINIKKFL